MTQVSPRARLASFKLPQLGGSRAKGRARLSSISDCSNVLAGARADYGLINSSNDWVAASGPGLQAPPVKDLLTPSYSALAIDQSEASPAPGSQSQPRSHP